MSASRLVPHREYLSAKQVARRLEVSVRTVWRWLEGGKLPPPIRYSRRYVRWRVGDIEAFLREPPSCRCPPVCRPPSTA